MSRDNGSSAVLTAFVLGAFAGAAVALLFAPAAGKETRERLGEKAREGRDRANDLFQRQRQHLEHAIERGKEAYRDARAAAGGTQEPQA